MYSVLFTNFESVIITTIGERSALACSFKLALLIAALVSKSLIVD